MPEPARPPRLQFCSDVDGVRHAVVGASEFDCGGWSVECLEDDGRVRVVPFEVVQLYRTDGRWNFLGHGEARQAWVAVVDWGSTAVALVSPDGRRLER